MTEFPRTQPHLRCEKWLGGLLHPSPSFSPSERRGFRPLEWLTTQSIELGSLLEVRGTQGMQMRAVGSGEQPVLPILTSRMDGWEHKEGAVLDCWQGREFGNVLEASS